MAYDSIFSKSFSRHEQKKFGYGALIGCLIVALSFFTVLKPYLGPLPILNLQLSMGTSLAKLVIEDTSSSQQLVAEREVKDNTRSSQQIVAEKEVKENTSSSQQLVAEKEVKVDTSNSQQLVAEKVLKENNSSSSQQLVTEKEVKEDPSSSQQLVAEKEVKEDTSPSQQLVAEKEVKEDTSPSQQLVAEKEVKEDTSSSQQLVAEKEVKVDTSKSQQLVAETEVKEDTSSSLQLVAESEAKEKSDPLCNILDRRADVCEVEGDIRIHGQSSTILASSSQIGKLRENDTWSIRPYARKSDKTAMSLVKELSLKRYFGHDEAPHCTVNHSVPAIVFSIGGYSGNHFHAFTDILIPLFITSHQFHGEVQFLITDVQPYWIVKFQAILKQLSRYEIINIDKDDRIHCFPSMIVGLKCHKELSIDPSKSPNGYSMKDFTQFLRNAYSLKRKTAIKIRDHRHKKPRLLIISRRRTRSFTNEGEIAQMARSLGYEVVVTEGTSNLTKFARIVNSCDVMMGVHGAGLTNSVFLPAKAILIQIIPLAGLEWLARYDFGLPASDMNLRYLEYKIKDEESTLIQQYPLDHPVFKDPHSISKQGWMAVKTVYLDKQNVKLDVGRFRATLLEALELLHH